MCLMPNKTRGRQKDHRHYHHQNEQESDEKDEVDAVSGSRMLSLPLFQWLISWAGPFLFGVTLQTKCVSSGNERIKRWMKRMRRWKRRVICVFCVSFHVTTEVQDALLVMTVVSDTNTQKILMSWKKWIFIFLSSSPSYFFSFSWCCLNLNMRLILLIFPSLCVFLKILIFECDFEKQTQSVTSTSLWGGLMLKRFRRRHPSYPLTLCGHVL